MGPKKRGKKQAASAKRVTRSRGDAASAMKSEEEEVYGTMDVEEEHKEEEEAAKMETEEDIAPVEELEDEKHEEPEKEENVENQGEERFYSADEGEKDEEVQLGEEANAEAQSGDHKLPEDEGMFVQEEDLPEVSEVAAAELGEACAGTEEVGVATKTFVIGSPEAAAGSHTMLPDEDYSPIINAALSVKTPMDEITVEEKAAAVAEAAEAAVAEAVEAAVGDITQVAETKHRSRKPRNKWSKEEDHELMKLITAQGLTEASPLSAVASVDFNAIAQQLNLGRTAKQCRDRWKNYLRGGIKKGGWSKDEEELIKDMYSTFGPKWTAMAKLLTNRTDNDIKNKWYSMKRKEERMGLHETSIYPKNLANRVSTSDDQDVADVPEHIAQRAATLSRVGVVGNPEPNAPTVAALAPAASAEAESDSAVFVDRNWSVEIDADQAGV